MKHCPRHDPFPKQWTAFHLEKERGSLLVTYYGQIKISGYCRYFKTSFKLLKLWNTRQCSRQLISEYSLWFQWRTEEGRNSKPPFKELLSIKCLSTPCIIISNIFIDFHAFVMVLQFFFYSFNAEHFWDVEVAGTWRDRRCRRESGQLLSPDSVNCTTKYSWQWNS